MAIQLKPKPKAGATTFGQLLTTCACGAPTSVYFFDPFRAYCARHAPSQLGSVRA